MGQTTLILMIITVISKIFGFVRESVMAAYIGAGELKSIYATATSIPTMLTGVVATGLISGYIPIFNRIKNEEGEERALEFTSNILNVLLLLGALSLILVYIFSEPILKLLSPKLSGESLKVAVKFTRIIMISIFPLMYSTIIRGYLNIKGNFIDPAFSGIILNILVITSTILSGKLSNPYILIIGTLIANIFQFVRFPLASNKLGFSHSMTLDISDKYLQQLRLIVIPIFLSALISQVSLVIDNSMASAFFGVSSISKLFYAKAMLNFIMGVVTLSVTTVTFPDIAKAGRNGDMKILNSKVSSAIVFSMLLVIPATFGMMALSNPIIKFAFERNAFTSYDTEVVASLLVSYAPYIIFTSIIKIISNGFYSIEDSKTPLIAIIIQLVLNIVLNVVLSRIFGLDGLAYATSVSTAISCVLMIYIFNNKFGQRNRKKNIASIIKILLSSLIMIVVAISTYSYLSVKLPLIVSLIISVIVSGIIYITCICFSKIDEADHFRNEFVNRFKSRE